MRPYGDLGRYLFDALAEVVQKVVALGMHLGETYVLGDSPLVLLTALVTAFEPGTASSFYVTRPCPRIRHRVVCTKSHGSTTTDLHPTRQPDAAGRPVRQAAAAGPRWSGRGVACLR